jgi:hypothetical protein
VKWILAKIIGFCKNPVKDLTVFFHIPFKQCHCELGLVSEMVEETALRNANGRNQFIDRRSRKALCQHR